MALTMVDVSLSAILNELASANSSLVCWTRASDIGTCEKQDNFFNAFDDTLNFIPDAAKMKYANLDRATLETYIPLIPEVGACKQVVLGTLEDLAPYFYHNKLLLDQKLNVKFSLLSAKAWSEGLNREFVTCAMSNHLRGQINCDYPVRLLIPTDTNRLLKKYLDLLTARITYLELCIVNAIIQDDKNISTKKYMGDFPGKTDPELGFDIYFVKIGATTGGGKKPRRKKSTHKKRQTRRRPRTTKRRPHRNY